MVLGPWNDGKSLEMDQEWQYIEDSIKHVKQTNGLLDEKAKGTKRTEQTVQNENKSLGA